MKFDYIKILKFLINPFNLFIFLISFLLIEGLYSFFYYKISWYLDFLVWRYDSRIEPFIWNENGLVENLQIFFLLFTIFLYILFLKKKEVYFTSKFLICFFYLYFLGLTFFFFEEISWGQHFFNWQSPEFFLNNNKQKETNIHNISNLFNQVPRSLLLIWCCLSFYIAKKLQKYKKYKNLSLFVYPDKSLKKYSYIIFLFVMPDLLLDKLNLYVQYPISRPGEWLLTHPIEFIADYEIMAFITFNFVKLSELHELLFAIYILNHAFYIKKLKFIKNSS